MRWRPHTSDLQRLNLSLYALVTAMELSGSSIASYTCESWRHRPIRHSPLPSAFYCAAIEERSWGSIELTETNPIQMAISTACKERDWRQEVNVSHSSCSSRGATGGSV